MNGNNYDESDPSTWDEEKLEELTKPDSIPTPEPVEEVVVVKQPIKTAPSLVSPYSAIDKKKNYNNDLTHYLPNQLLTDEDLEKCVDNCYTLAKQHSSDSLTVANLKDVIGAFQHISYNTFAEEYTTFFTNNVGRLVQYIENTTDGTKLRMAYQNVNIDKEAETISGDTALRYLSKITNTGRPIKIYLWHSGIWLTLSPFTENELLDLNIALQDEKQTLGINTLGASFSGDDVHIVGTIIEFIMTHIENNGCNIKDYTVNKLRKLISVRDIPCLLIGALSVIYPDGYPIFHPCVNTKTEIKCTYNLTAEKKENGDFKPDSKLHFNRMWYTNPQHFTQEDISIFSAPFKTIKSEEAIALQNRLNGNVAVDTRKQMVWSIEEEDIGITEFYVGFKSPNLEDYLNSATEWVNEVSKMADEAISINSALSLSDREAKREKHLSSYAAVTELVKHSGWVKYFTLKEPNGREVTINDTATIKNYLKQYAMIDGFSESFNKALQAYKEDSIIAWTGIPNYECPECKCGQTDADSKTPTIIPINPVSYFFSTMVFRGRSRHLLTY